MWNYIFLLAIGGILSGTVRFFILYMKLPYSNDGKSYYGLVKHYDPNGIESSSVTTNKPPTEWNGGTTLAFAGYLAISLMGSFLTPMISKVLNLPGLEQVTPQFSEWGQLVLIGYALLFGYFSLQILVKVYELVTNPNGTKLKKSL